jgi:hypothetical protein
MRARGGTRTTFQPLETQGSPENIRNTGHFEACNPQSKPESVDNVHTPIARFRDSNLTLGHPGRARRPGSRTERLLNPSKTPNCQ